MKHIKTAVILLLFSASSCGKAQSITQTWIDPCTNTAQTATFPINGPGVLIIYRGQSKVFTAAQAQAGEVLAWINQITVNVPCPIVSNPVVTQTATQTATQAATQAASAAASSAASSSAGTAAAGAASSATSSAPPPTSSSNSSSAPSSTSSSGGESVPSESKPAETKSESSASESKSEEGGSESGSEEKSEEKKEEKKKGEARTNPLLVASDLTTGQNPDGSLSALFTTGVSQSSLAGDKSYGVTGILWLTFDQGAINASYSKTKFEKGKLKHIMAYANTVAYLKGTWMNMTGVTWVKPDPRWGVIGISANTIILAIPDDLENATAVSYASSLAAFWMHNPIQLSERAAFSPQIFLLGAPISYNDFTKFTFNKELSAMVGNSVDYKITKRFGMTGAHRVMVPSTGRPMHFILIGSRVTL